MICSASDFSSSGLSGCVSSPTSSPFARMVAGRPTLSSRSEPLRCTMLVMACLKLKATAGASAIWIHPEEDLPELDRLRVLDAHFLHHAADLGLDLVHDLHCFDDAHDLADVDPGPALHVGLRPRLGGRIEGPHHGRFDFQEMGDGGGRGRGRPTSRGAGGRRVRPRRGRLGHEHVPAPHAHVAVARLRDPYRRPGPEPPAPDLDRAHVGGVLEHLHELRDDVELHTVKIPPVGPYTSSTRSVRPLYYNAGPSTERCTSSSIRTPPRPGTYTPGSIVTTASSGSGSPAVRASRGASCTSSPNPCPVECPKASPKPRASIGSRASASASRPGIPARTPSRARRCAPATRSYNACCASVARAPTTTVRVMSAQYPSTTAPKSSSSHSPAATVRRLVCACGRALRGPDATMAGNGCPSLPKRRRAPSSRPAISSSICPGRTAAIVARSASPANVAAARIAATSAGSLQARSRSTNSPAAFQRHAFPAPPGDSRSASLTVRACAS